MKKIALALLIALAAVTAHAEEAWPRSYFASLGIGAFASNGDFNERTLSMTDTAGNKQVIHAPALEIFASPQITIGANIREFSVGLNFQFFKSEQTLNGFPDESTKGESVIWRISMEFTYNLFWPEFFQVGLGGSFSYSTVATDNSAFIGNEASEASFMGSAIGGIANVKYFITEKIAMVPYIKVYENWFRNVYTAESELCDLKSYMWQTFVFVGLDVQIQF